MKDKDRIPIPYRMQRIELADRGAREYSDKDNLLARILDNLNEEGDFIVGEIRGKVKLIRYSIVEKEEGVLQSIAIGPAYFISNRRPINVEFILPTYTLDIWHSEGTKRKLNRMKKRLAELIWRPEEQDFVYWEQDRVRRRVPADRLIPIGGPVVTEIDIKNLSPMSVQTRHLPDDKIAESLEKALNHLREWDKADLENIDAYCADEGNVGEFGREYSTIINAYQFYRIKNKESLQIDMIS